MARNARPPVKIGDDDKLMPNSARWTLIEMRRQYHALVQSMCENQIVDAERLPKGPDREDFANILNATKEAQGSRYRVGKITERKLRSIELGETLLKYWQIELYASIYEIPSALVLLISRFDSENKEDRTRQETVIAQLELLGGLEATIHELRSLVLKDNGDERLARSMIWRLAEIFRKSARISRHGQLQLI